ncbi:MAG: right-handed parallel beta-helix repeat-containing protein [Pseudomonadota bacterium]
MASTIYVDGNAKSGGDGSEDRPYATIQDAIDAAQPGTTIMVLEGTYYENLEIERSGTKDAPITLKSADGPGKAVIKPADRNDDTIQIDGKDHIVIDGFELHGNSDKQKQVIHIHAVSNLTDPASNIEIINNVIYRGAGDAIKISKSTDILVQNNEIIGGGRQESHIDIVGGARVVIDSNTLKDINFHGINMKAGSRDIVVTNNDLSGALIGIEVGGYAFLHAYPPGFLSSGKAYEVSNVLVQGNRIADSESWSLRLIGAQNVDLIENDFSDARDRIIRIDDSSKMHEPWFTKNVVFSDNEVPFSNWLTDESKDANPYFDDASKSFFKEWDGFDLEALLRGEDEEPIIEKDEDKKPKDDDKKPEDDEDRKVDDDVAPGSREVLYPEAAAKLNKWALEAAKAETSAGRDSLRGTSAQDVVHAQAGNDFVKGAAGNDLIFGGTGRDRLVGNKGNDTLSGGEHNDLLRGGRRDDLMFGDEGNDSLRGEHGNDTLLGGDGKDRLEGHRGDDHLFGGDGKDHLRGGKDMDWLEGGRGNDSLSGGRGADTLLGDSGNDTVLGVRGDDVLSGGAGNDKLSGGKGADTMFGGAGNDKLKGNRGNDVLEGGAGDDTLKGGTGADQFVFRRDDAGGENVVLDFNSDENDLLVLDGFGTFADLDSNGDGVINGKDDYVTKTKEGLDIDLSELSGKTPGSHILSVSQSVLTTDDFIFLA